MKIMYNFLLFTSFVSFNLIDTAVAQDGEIVDIPSKNSSLCGGPPPSPASHPQDEGAPGPLLAFLESFSSSAAAAVQGKAGSQASVPVSEEEMKKLTAVSMTTLPGFVEDCRQGESAPQGGGALSSVSSLDELADGALNPPAPEGFPDPKLSLWGPLRDSPAFPALKIVIAASGGKPEDIV